MAASLGFVLLAALLTAGMVAGRRTSDLLFYACAFAQAGVSLLAGFLAAGSASRAVFAVLVGGAVLLRLALIPMAPSLSDDVYRYVWDGRIVNAGFNPFLHVPADPALAHLRDPAQYERIDKKDYAVTIYPPVAQALFAAVTRLSDEVWAMKLAMVLFEGVAVLAAWRLLLRLRRPSGLLAIYLLHPAPLWEFAGNGHVDAAMMAFLFGALAWGGGAARPVPAALAMTLGALVKPTAALGLPALWRPVQILLPLLVVAFAALCYLPFVGAGLGVFGFVSTYAREQGLDTGEGVFWLAALRRLGIQRNLMAPYAALAGASLLGLALWTRRRGDADLRTALGGTAALIVAFLLLLTPVYPWYFLVALPFTPLLGLWSPFALATGGVLLYTFQADTPVFFGRWCVFTAIAVLAAAVDVRLARTKRTLP